MLYAKMTAEKSMLEIAVTTAKEPCTRSSKEDAPLFWAAAAVGVAFVLVPGIELVTPPEGTAPALTPAEVPEVEAEVAEPELELLPEDSDPFAELP